MVLLSVFFCIGISGNHAQVLNTPTAYENIYPFGSPKGDLPSCYSWSGANLSGINGDIYLSSVNEKVIYRFTQPNTPSVTYTQGTISYPNCQDINVGYMVDNSGGGWTNLIVVSYYKNGSGATAGHYYDVYKWSFSSISLISSTQLDNMANYTRISMDSHFFYGIVITWQTSNGLYALTGLWGAFTSPVYLNGTGGMENPDVAFSHSTSGGLLCQFVYDYPWSAPSYDIYQTMLDFYTLNGASGSITPSIQDINTVTSLWSGVNCSIDAPDHYPVDNWAYTYAIDGADVYVRYMDYNTSSLGTTNVVDGSVLGNLPIKAKELRPRIAYNQNCKSFHVSWYSTYTDGTNGACYFSEEIGEDGVTLISVSDYELMAANSAFPIGANLNSVTLSKQNDNSTFLYGVFLDNAGVHHTFHKWSNHADWRTAIDPAVALIKDNCQNSRQNATTSVSKLASEHEKIVVGPNPFAKKITLFIPASLKDDNIILTVTDVAGKILLYYNGNAAKAPAEIERVSEELSPGSYFVNTKMQKSGVQQNIKLIKSTIN